MAPLQTRPGIATENTEEPSSHNVDQAPGDDDDFFDGAAFEELFDFFTGQGGGFHFGIGGVRGNDYAVAQLAVDLHRHFNGFFHEQRGIEFWPRLIGEAGIAGPACAVSFAKSSSARCGAKG